MIGKNNCLNIRSTNKTYWKGQTGATRGFCDFESYEFCLRAGAYLIMKSYRRAKCYTVQAIIRRWAPPNENNTEAYIKFVCAVNGWHRLHRIDTLDDVARLLSAMQIMEVGKCYMKPEKIEEIIRRFRLTFIV